MTENARSLANRIFDTLSPEGEITDETLRLAAEMAATLSREEFEGLGKYFTDLVAQRKQGKV
jgi:hypothetical protein